MLADTATDETDAIVVTIAAFGTEGADRQDLKLDTKERAVLERAIRDAKQHTCKLIVLLNVAGPVELGEYLPDIDALLCMYFPGQEGAHAAADILYGRVNPSGKLAQTFPKHLYDCPALEISRVSMTRSATVKGFSSDTATMTVVTLNRNFRLDLVCLIQHFLLTNLKQMR